MSVTEFFNHPRFKNISRDYTLDELTNLVPDLQHQSISNKLSLRLYHQLQQLFHQKKFTSTFGCLDPVQLIEMSKYVDTIYVSGWQCASAVTQEPGPDLADYPMDTVPRKVDQLVKAQVLHNRKYKIQNQSIYARNIFKPIIADGDTGHGGITAVMKLTKLFIEAGASGIHLEDQKAGTKKCGHMGGKVLVSTQEHVNRLKAARLQADIMKCPLVIIARSDAESGKYIDSNIDPHDHPFIMGRLKYIQAVRDPGVENGAVREIFLECTLPEAILELRKEMSHMSKPCVEFEKIEDLYGSYDEMMNTLKKMLGCTSVWPNGWVQFEYDWECLRSPEGYYRTQNGTKYATHRCLKYGKYADLLWMETSKPKYSQAEYFAREIHSKYPEMMLAYNLSPSFNWDNADMTDNEIGDYMTKIGKLGFVWQFITLAGFHVNGYHISKFAKGFQENGMLEYVKEVQRKERESGNELLTHQKWSGAGVIDYVNSLITRNGVTNINSDNSTETQF